jgi:SpoIIAA-like
MPYTIKYDPDLDVMDLLFTGEVSGNDIREATTKCITLQNQTGVLRFIVEVNGWEVVASFVDIYNLAYKQYSEEKAHRDSRIAVVLPTTLSGQVAVNFYETVCQNAGWNAQVFSDREHAIDWLSSSQGSGNMGASNSVRDRA